MPKLVPEVKLSVRIPKRLFNGRGIIDKGIQRTRDNTKQGLLHLTKKVFREKNLIATGRLFRSLRAITRRSGSGWYQIVIVSEGAPRRYLPYVEEGLPPGRRINKSELLLWLRARKINEAALENIARSLRRHGYKGRFPLREAQRRIPPAFRRTIEREVSKAVRNWVQG